MRRHPIALALVVACGLFASGLPAQTLGADASDAGPVPMLEARALDQAPATRMKAARAMDSAVAAAVIGAVARQFDADQVSVRLHHVQVEAASFRERALRGSGEIGIGAGAEWIPFDF